MAPITIQHVVSFSSEDPKFPADNLLKDGSLKGWKCANAGEKQAYVVLQLEKAISINGVDIGNSGSAFVEVLVSRSGGNEENWQVLLGTSSFMSPQEARSESNCNRVRIFQKDDLNQTVLTSNKWDRVKLVCTQPFNKHIQFGLCFVKMHSPQAASSDESSKLTLGGFKLRKEEDSKQGLSVGSLFAKRKMLQTTDEEQTTAAKIRKASESPETTEQPKSPKILKASRPPDRPSEKPAATPKAKQTMLSAVKQEAEKMLNEAKMATQKAAQKETKLVIKGGNTNKKVLFDQLMKGVIFAISGYQNPLRAELRTKALEMGAKYRPDWDPTCTHLICAFSNTPKFRQVKGKGIIVNKDWIEKGHSTRKRLPWQRFRLDSANSSDEEEDEIIEAEEEQEEAMDTDEEIEKVAKGAEASEKVAQKAEDPNDMDTDEEVEQITKKAEGKKDGDYDSAYDADTDVEDEETRAANEKRARSLPHLPELFKGELIAIYDAKGDEEWTDQKVWLERVIIGFGGKLTKCSSSSSDITLLVVDNKNKIKQLSKEYPNAKIVTPAYMSFSAEHGKVPTVND